MNRVYEFLKAAETYDLATVEGDQPPRAAVWHRASV